MESSQQGFGQSPISPISESGLNQSPIQERGCAKDKQHIRDLGITILSEGTQPVVEQVSFHQNIFLIHGLQGHPRKTFTYFGPQEESSTPLPKVSRLSKIFSRSSKKGLKSPVSPQSPHATPATPEVFWPLDLLPHDFPNARIATFGYDSKVTHWFKGPAMQLDIFSYGESLLNTLDARRRADPERPLIFIVHSLGGLILKDVLRRARTSVNVRFKSVYTSVKAVFFFGTPHRGGSYVNLGLTVRKLAACAGFDTNDVLLRNLKFDSGVAKLLREEFAKMLDERRLHIFTFQEAVGLTGFGPLSGKVVEDSSSELDYAHEQKDFINANHVDMCRFSGFQDDGYEKTKDCLISCLESISHDLSHQSSPGLRDRLLASLNMPETQERFNQVDEAYENTCGWIFERETLGFVHWLQTGKGIFWINGKPGSGKSTVMKFVVSNHQTFQYLYMNRPKHRLIWAEFFFSNRGKQVQKTLEGLYHRILYQLLKQAEYLTRFVQPIFENSAEAQGIWSLIYLEAAMLAIVKQREEKINICLFIDALDEQAENYAQDHRRLVETMQNLIKQSDDKTVRVMFCVSSRPETFFMDSFACWPGIRIHENTHDDVRVYVNGRLNSYLALRPDLAANPSSVASLQKTFDEVFLRAQGVFLWVKLVTTDLIEGLMDGDNPGQIQQHLSSIPGNGDLHELYHLILLSLKSSYLNDTFVMLQIAYATLEPLPITEFFSAVNYVLKNTNPELESQSFDEMERRLLSRCRGFLEVQTASWQDQECEKHTGKIVQFLHQSVKDYLAQEQSFETIQRKLRIDYPINGHVHLLKFFTSQHLRKYARQPEELYQLPQFDLRKFSVLYHSRMVEQTLRMVVSGPLDALAKYIDHNELTSVYLRIDGWECPESWKPSFLALATQAGLLLYVEQELRRLGGPNKLSGRPLLHWAVMPSPAGLCTMPTDPFVNSQEMIRLLRRLGANLEEEFEYQKFEPRTAFGWAFRQFTFRGAISPVNLATLKTLLSEGANPNVLADQTMTALQLCVRNSDRLLARLLLDFNARIEILTAADWTHLERFNKPMSTIKAFRDGDLRARDMELFANFYAQEDDQQKPKNLLKQYRSGKLAIRNGEVYVGDWDFVLEYEKSVKRFFRFYEEGEWVGSSMPRPLAECGIRTKSEILLDWAMPPDTMDYWY